jgi:hypothetical protein
MSTLEVLVGSETQSLAVSTAAVPRGLATPIRALAEEPQTFAPQPHLPIAWWWPVAVVEPEVGLVVPVELAD